MFFIVPEMWPKKGMSSDLKFIVDYCIILKFLLRYNLNRRFTSREL